MRMFTLLRKNKILELKINCQGNAIPRGNSPIRRILRGEKLSQYQIAIRTDSGNFYTESSGDALYDEKGDFVVGMLLAHDITDRVKSQEKLLIKTQLDLFDQVIENLEVGFTRYTYPEFNIIDINNRTYKYLKEFNPKLSSPSSIIGKGIANIFNLSRDKEAEFKRRIQIAIGAKIKPNSIYKSIVTEGKERFLKLVHQPLFGLNNQVVEIVGISIDITGEVKAKKEMEQILKIQEELFANVSHELKTPLNVIFSANQLMELYIKNNLFEANKEKVSQNITIIKQNCYRFIKLINNIVDLSKIESGFLKLDLSNENIVKITEDIVQSVSEYIKRKRLSIVFDTNIEEKIIACDPEKIERIILNLISNAIKFSNPGGSILVNLIDKGDTIKIVVEDTGIGIDRKHLDMIFERFQQADKSLSRNAEGSGIGLYLVKSIIEMHGGKISVESTVGKGSIFKVELPSKTFEKQEQIYESKSQDNKIEMIDIYAV
ncbi:sensor histidine kinase [Clostridium magnum]|uniref:sensor histidine kinase n=1 Tax=Clostridium magnum TaxID=33954 RepID=UPI001FA8E8FF|nr:PAS domain-containing sensor histidine kinase [Clostridium magnum]